MHVIGRMRTPTLLGLWVCLALVAAACAGDGADEATADGADDAAATEVAAGDDGAGEAEELSLDQVVMAADNGDFMDSIIWSTADARYWPEAGFIEPVNATVTQDFIPAIVGGSAWVVQGENNIIWGAMAEGSVSLKSIGVHMDGEAWLLGIDADVDPDDLEGLRITGGVPGERNVTIGRSILEELGFDADNVEWVTVPGGPEERFRALAADQVDMAVLQPELRPQLEEIGGQFIYNEMQVVPQAGWVVLEETLENNRDAVCAFVEGQLAARQWLSEGEDRTDNQETAVELGVDYGLEPTEGDLQEWGNFLGDVLSTDGGSPADSFDEWTEDMVDQEIVPEDFTWSDHVDFTCLWEAQEALGLELNPDPDDMP